ncbi:MAG: hypothetical protein ABGZ23_12545 [Fuerstiella sp.]
MPNDDRTTPPSDDDGSQHDASIEETVVPDHLSPDAVEQSVTNLDAQDDEQPDRIGPYKILQQIGKGGMGRSVILIGIHPLVPRTSL